MKSASIRRGPFRELGIVGLTSIEAPVLAALATESPLLLVGPHGSAKSLLLTQIATALGLAFRHYNASLLNFDDLVGFPLPGKDGSLEYVRTPASIWGAGAVIFDEISRCRPDVQNKLFSIIHERRVQGIALEGLRHRWAAMNPPCTEDGDSGDNGYVGSEPLDVALADRFAFVVTMPTWSEFQPEEQLAVIQAVDSPVNPAAANALIAAIERTRLLLEQQPASFVAHAAHYVQTMIALLGQSGIAFSPRRANMMWRAVRSVNAASLALDPESTSSDATLLAMRSSLPQRAQGISIQEIHLLAAHREAVRRFKFEANDPMHAILSASSPLERFRLATRAASLPRADFSTVVADVVAQLAPGSREAAIVHLFETGVVGRLNVAVAAQAAEIYRDLATPREFSCLVLDHSRNRSEAWGRIQELLSRLDPADVRAHLQANAMVSMFEREQLQTPRDADQAFAAFGSTDQILRAS